MISRMEAGSRSRRRSGWGSTSPRSSGETWRRRSRRAPRSSPLPCRGARRRPRGRTPSRTWKATSRSSRVPGPPPDRSTRCARTSTPGAFPEASTRTGSCSPPSEGTCTTTRLPARWTRSPAHSPWSGARARRALPATGSSGRTPSPCGTARSKAWRPAAPARACAGDSRARWPDSPPRPRPSATSRTWRRRSIPTRSRTVRAERGAGARHREVEVLRRVPPRGAGDRAAQLPCAWTGGSSAGGSRWDARAGSRPSFIRLDHKGEAQDLRESRVAGELVIEERR